MSITSCPGSFRSCPHYKELKPLLFQHRSDCLHCPAELRQTAKSWPSQTLAWGLVCSEQSLQKAPTSYICFLVFSCYFIWFVFKSHFPWLLFHGNIFTYVFRLHTNPKWSIVWVQSRWRCRDCLRMCQSDWGLCGVRSTIPFNPGPSKREILNSQLMDSR